MSKGKAKRVLVLSAILFLALISPALGFDDGFSQAQKIESKYFSIYTSGKVDTQKLAQTLNMGTSDKILAGESRSAPASHTLLGGMLDTLFLRVCDILDMHLYTFKCRIKIAQDGKQLDKIYKGFFNRPLEAHSFYVYSLNTVYISGENFQAEILGHEMAHAIISHYFVVQPPVKMQEVLAGYVEYQLRKGSQSK